MRSSWRRTLVAGTALALVALSAGPAGAQSEPAATAGTEAAAPAEGGRSRVAVQAVPAPGAPPQVLVTANRMVNGDGGTNGKCMEIAGGGVGSTYVQMAPCQSYAHQGWTERAWSVTLPNGHTRRAYTVESHDGDAAGRCLTYTGHAVQARMFGCGYLDTFWIKRDAPSAWHQLESVEAWYYGYSVTGNLDDRKCLDVHVNTGQTTNVVHHWTCGPLNKGNQLFRVQAA